MSTLGWVRIEKGELPGLRKGKKMGRFKKEKVNRSTSANSFPS